MRSAYQRETLDESGLAGALDAWQDLLGPDRAHCRHDALQAASTGTFATTSRVLAILEPETRTEVQDCVRIANRYRVPLYPVSSGKNWGYGSRVPVRDAALLHLGRLNRILDFDEDLGYVTIEPGVTQRQLFEFLRARNSRLWMDATGASPECSIVGNTMERGFGHTPMGDHCANACGLEVVLPDGEVLETGFSRFPGATTGALGRWGVGPSLDGLFSQSNLGIVTRMSVWLMPAPEHFEAFFFMSRDEQGLGPLIDALRPLRMSGTLRSVVHVGNDYKVLAASSQYPWAEMQGRAPLDREYMAAVRAKLGIGCWNASGGLYGTRRQVTEAKRLLRRALAGKVDRLQFVNDRLLGLMTRFAGPFRMATGWDVRPTLKVLGPVYNLLRGVPTDQPLRSAYWRKRTSVPADPDPDRDGCGLLWCSPVVPNTGQHAMTVAALACRLLLEHGFEPQMSISLATERTLVCVITISYDREEPGEDAKALACYQRLHRELLALGYPPYRSSTLSMDASVGQARFGAVLSSLKTALDPNMVLAPGRYEQASTTSPRR
jgi:4-cresol dehydrogenase (hydroxylating) flavoprotein subunit